MTPEQRHALTDAEVITLYERWSDEEYLVGFMDPAPEQVTAFRAWLLGLDAVPREPYEAELLTEFRRQEGEA